NEGMNTRMETVDAYMEIIPPGSRSGKHRHLAEECVYVLEGRGYDLHQDCDVEITDTYHWTPQAEVKRYEWEAGDVIYIPPNTIHQHFNASADKPARLISATNRIYKACGLNDLEQLEDAPEYDPAVTLSAELVGRYLCAGSASRTFSSALPTATRCCARASRWSALATASGTRRRSRRLASATRSAKAWFSRCTAWAATSATRLRRW